MCDNLINTLRHLTNQQTYDDSLAENIVANLLEQSRRGIEDGLRENHRSGQLRSSVAGRPASKHKILQVTSRCLRQTSQEQLSETVRIHCEHTKKVCCAPSSTLLRYRSEMGDVRWWSRIVFFLSDFFHELKDKSGKPCFITVRTCTKT